MFGKQSTIGVSAQLLPSEEGTWVLLWQALAVAANSRQTEVSSSMSAFNYPGGI